MFMVVTYDISDDARRLRVAKELENWGERTQFSVFECELTEAQEATLLERLRAICSEGGCTTCLQAMHSLCGEV